MLIAGVNLGNTRVGRPLKDGGACLLDNGSVVVGIAEERLSREKHSGGFSRSLEYCLLAIGAKYSDLDMVVASSCGEEPLKDGCDIGLPISSAKVRIIPSHHLSHAYSAFLTSPFETAAIMVLDNEGNFVDRRNDPIYWNNPMERNSYYTGIGKHINLLESCDDELADDETGIGEAYRHFTYFLGWHSYVYAGKTMGLAPYGAPEAFEDLKVFNLHSGQIHSLLVNGREDPSRAVTELSRLCNVDIGRPRSPEEKITQTHRDIAAVIQKELECALIYKACRLHELTGATNLCLGGGIALNCVANRKILDNTPFERIYICPAPGDSGQCIGNALYGWVQLREKSRSLGSLTPYLGRVYSENDVSSAIAIFKNQITYMKSTQVSEDTAQMISDGHVIGWFQGRSELGPRALGARSILADPRQPAMRDYLNLVIKRREIFRPFAPSVLEAEVGRFLDLPQLSPYMELTGEVLPTMRKYIPSVTHIDGSSRAQSVADCDNPLFAELLHAFDRLTNLPVILNTSFNLGGEPIVESPIDALNCFLASNLDALVLGDFIIRRSGDSLTPGFAQWLSETGQQVV